ncbi:conserved hypothetical protein [Teredinibacter turnerae T7901]|uniref:Uncharacterized protein n=1 Tax=Teredinibacter turnerae (strain ATCC 39867 / T7901) TaxID=377629 RepID=C5BUH0_TERTT|nr:hypothetical protein [Teredinibacter turnerae]ACR13588.1 conserved hypothetical protein [Teredinibacter turnerae T7901]
MNCTQKEILENLFDALDRLFDRESKVIDIYAIMFASEKAVSGEAEVVNLSEYSYALKMLIPSGKAEEAQREEALLITNELRNILNELLPI